jgi:hypothetical protein
MKSPGPGAYEKGSFVGEKKTGGKFGNERRPQTGKKVEYEMPGPGAYN